MLIEAGFDIAFECPARTTILQLSIHPSRDADLLTPDRIASDPPLPMRGYLDLSATGSPASRFHRARHVLRSLRHRIRASRRKRRRT